MNRPARISRRSDQTRAALLTAFTALVFERGFDRVSVRDVVSGAGTARSTFYEHFSNIEDALQQSMAHLFTEVADCVASQEQPLLLTKVLDHLWENRRLTDAIFSGQARVVLRAGQADMIELRLRREGAASSAGSLRLVATAIAELQLTLIEQWLRGRAFARAGALAELIHRTSRAAAFAALDAGNPSTPL